MRAGPGYCGFPAPRTGAISGAGDEEVFETKASPPAVAGPFFAPPGPPYVTPPGS